MLFNIVQNAVKFNMYKGSILVLISCKPMQEQDRICLELMRKKKAKWSPSSEQPDVDSMDHLEDYILETHVIDTGYGMSIEKQKLLFKPFKELRKMQSINYQE